MNYWTNVHIPHRFDAIIRQGNDIAELHFKLTAKQAECDLLYKELENIFTALQKGAVVTMTYEKEQIKVKAVSDDQS